MYGGLVAKDVLITQDHLKESRLYPRIHRSHFSVVTSYMEGAWDEGERPRPGIRARAWEPNGSAHVSGLHAFKKCVCVFKIILTTDFAKKYKY